MSQENEGVLEEQSGVEATEEAVEQPMEEMQEQGQEQEQEVAEADSDQDQGEGEDQPVEAEEATEKPEVVEEAAQVESHEDSSEDSEKGASIGDIIAVSIIALIVGLLLCMPTFLGSHPQGTMEYDLSGGVAASVNGVSIGENDVTNYINSFRMAQGLTEDEDWGTWLTEYGYTPEALRSATIEYFISRELVGQAVKSEGIEVSDEDVEAQLAQVAEQLGGEEALEEALASEGMTLEEYRDVIVLNLQQQALAEKAAGDAELVADEEVLEIMKMYYPDDVDADADTLEGLDEETVESVRSYLEQSKIEQAYSEWMEKYKAEVDIVTNDMPEGLPYAIDLEPFAQSAQDSSDELIELEADEEADVEGEEEAK